MRILLRDYPQHLRPPFLFSQIIPYSPVIGAAVGAVAGVYSLFPSWAPPPPRFWFEKISPDTHYVIRQVRFPRSKRRRIQKKWATNISNWAVIEPWSFCRRGDIPLPNADHSVFACWSGCHHEAFVVSAIRSQYLLWERMRRRATRSFGSSAAIRSSKFNDSRPELIIFDDLEEEKTNEM